jgi:general secretion pathway protein I
MTGRREQGFTLVEALVAFAILAVVLVAAFRTAGTGLRAIDAAATTEGAVLAARSQMDRIIALRQLSGPRKGQIEGTPYKWELEVLPPSRAWSLQPLARKPAHVRLTVAWPSRGGTSRIQLERVIFLERAMVP